jgi:hypothetical protein
VRTEAEIRAALETCERVRTPSMSEGPCPLSPVNDPGVCHHCNSPAALAWALQPSERPPVPFSPLCHCDRCQESRRRRAERMEGGK